VELLSTLGIVQGHAYPKAELDRLWKLVLLNQFHDAIPGSSIEMVYHDMDKMYKDVETSGTQLLHSAFEHVLRDRMSGLWNEKDFAVGGKDLLEACLCFYGSFVRSLASRLLQTPLAVAFVNTLGCARHEVVEIELPEDLQAASLPFQQVSKSGNRGLVAIQADAMGLGIANLKADVPRVSVMAVADGFVLDNETCKVTLNNHGEVCSYFDKANRRELIKNGEFGNVFRLFDDQCLFWDAWDLEVYHDEKPLVVGKGQAEILETGPLRASLVVMHPLTKHSSLKQTISLNSTSPRLDFDCEVEWHENRKCLKVEFQVDIRSEFATYETAFGWVQRPTHYNTSWDLAKFEVCGHRFADLSEYGYGVALLNDCKYGHSTHGNVMRLTLLRAPKSPDANCDMGQHQFKYAIYPHRGTFAESDVVQEGLRFNAPLITRIVPKPKAEVLLKPLFELENAPNVILDAVKRAEDDDKAIIVRMYEAYGGRTVARLKTSLPVKQAVLTNLLEDELATLKWEEGCEVEIGPFKVSLRSKL
jgi:alpha-mannosidase